MVAERVTKCIAHLLGFSDADKNGIEPEDELEGKLGMDSLDKIELVMALEEEFEIMIPDEDAEKCKTVADVVALVERMTAGGVVA